jgi:hypothetical protein
MKSGLEEHLFFVCRAGSVEIEDRKERYTFDGMMLLTSSESSERSLFFRKSEIVVLFWRMEIRSS